MSVLRRADSANCLWALLLAFQMATPVRGTIRDGGIDPANLGKGEWIYQMHHAVAGLNGNVPSVTDVPSLMIYLKNQGVRYIIVKAGTGADLFGVPGFNPQFTSSLVNQAHAAGLWIFGYNRSYATNTAGEVAIANYVFQQGADGFVWDAEAEWESSRIGSQGPALAIAQCVQVRSNWPNKFLAHSPFAYINYHSSFPYKEFGYYCDAAFPQDYWIQFGETPSAVVTKMSSAWRNWQNGLSGQWVNSIRPIVPAGQAYNGDGIITAAQITEFVNALKTDPNPATAGGYKGVNYWVAEDHPPDVWDAVRTNSIGNVPTNNAPVIGNVSVTGVNSSSATMTWTTDQSSDSVVEYGLDTSYGSARTNSALIYYHTVSLTSLSPYSTYHFRVKSRNAYNRTGVSSDYLFTTTAATVSDVIIESYLPGPTLNPFPPYQDSQFVGSHSTCKSSAPGLNGVAAVRYATGGAGSSPSVTLRPTLAIAGGSYDVYVTHCATSCSADLVATVGQVGCSGLPGTTPVFQSAYGNNTWALVGRLTLNPGVTTPTVSFTRTGGTLGSTSRMYSDAYKFVYVPPPPTGPSLTTPPQSQSVTQGYSATFSVAATGTPLLYYQWRFNGTNNVSGATGSVYTRPSVQASDAGKYSVLVTNAYGVTNSQEATLSVLVPADIVVSPTDVETGLGLDATFNAVATGTPPLGYQWRFNGTNIAGATTNTWTVTNVQPGSLGGYSVVVSNLYGTDTSYDGFLTILDPYIAGQPQNQTLVLGATAVFMVGAVGTPTLGFRWQKEGVALSDDGRISGTGTPALTVANAQAGDMGNYSVIVSNLNGQVVSSNATLLGPYAPAILTHPAGQKVVAASPALLSVAVAGIGPFTYRWRRDGTNLLDGGKIGGAASESLMVSNLQITECGNYSVIVSNAYGGTTSSEAPVGLWPLAVWGAGTTNSGASPQFGQAVIPAGLGDLVAVAGGLYHSLAAKGDGTVAAWGAGWTNKGAGQYVQALVPEGLTNVSAVAAGYYHSLALRTDGTVVAWGAGTNNTGISPHFGQAQIPEGLGGVNALAAGGYHTLVLQGDGTVHAWGAGTNNTGVSPYYGQAMVPDGLTNVVAVAGGGYHSLALKADGNVVAWGAGTSDTGASPNYGQAIVPEGLNSVVAIAAGAYHSLALKADGAVVVWGAGMTNTGSSPYYGQALVPAGLSNVVAIAPGRYHSLALKADGTVLAWGDSSYGLSSPPAGLVNGIGIAGSGYHNLLLEGDGRPRITAQPFSQSAAAGTTVRLAALAVGAQPLNYQWQHNGMDLPGATEASLTLTNLPAASAGSYCLVVSNALGIAMSANAILSLSGQLSPPQIDSITRLPDGSYQLQISGGPGTFAVEAAPEPFGWTQLDSLTVTGTVSQYIDADTNQASRFYRIRLQP
jgi:hypothetical protein